MKRLPFYVVFAFLLLISAKNVWAGPFEATFENETIEVDENAIPQQADKNSSRRYAIYVRYCFDLEKTDCIWVPIDEFTFDESQTPQP